MAPPERSDKSPCGETKEYPYAYIRKKICRSKDATVPVQCKAVQYGLGIFSGIRGQWNTKQKNLYLFRMEDHFKRMQLGAKITGMRLNMTYPKFKELIFKLIKKNKVKGDIYIRPTLYAASTKLTPRFDNPDDDLAIYMIALKDYFDTSKGLDVCVSSWRRIDDSAISTKAKITGGYANSALAKTEAIMNGYDEPIFLNPDGKICEASGANLFGIKDGVIYTPPLADNNLNGITRRTVIELLEKEFAVPVREQSIDRSMLYAFDNLFFTGTAAKITWIRTVDKRLVGNGKMSRPLKALKTLFEKVSYGEVEHYSKWLTPVY